MGINSIPIDAAELSNLEAEYLNFLVSLCFRIAKTVDLPQEITVAMEAAVRKGILEAEQRLQLDKNEYVTKHFSTRVVLYNAVTALPIVGDAVSGAVSWFSGSSQENLDVAIHSNNLSAEQTMAPDLDLLIGSYPSEEKLEKDLEPPQVVETIHSNIKQRTQPGHQFDIRLGFEVK